MIFLKSLLFIVWNVAIGIMLINVVRWALFNTKCRFIFGLHIPLTPGFLIAKRDWVFNKVRAILHDFLDQVDNTRSFGYLSKWEKLVFDTVWEQVQFIDEWKLLPRSWKTKIRTFIAQIIKGIVTKILRQLIPKIIEQLQIEHRIDDFDEQFSSKMIWKYYNQYIHKYLLYFAIGLNLLIGITNMLLYLIIA